MESKNKGKDFCMFALPGMFCFFAVVIVPFIYGVYLTLTDWDGVAKVKNFIGLKNFAGVMHDKQFWTSLGLTFKYVIVVVILVNVIAFAIAYLLTRGIKGQNFFRAGFFTPNLIGGIVLGYIWQLIFNGVLSRYGTALALNEWYGFWGLIILVSWQQAGITTEAAAREEHEAHLRTGAGKGVQAARTQDVLLRQTPQERRAAYSAAVVDLDEEES